MDCVLYVVHGRRPPVSTMNYEQPTMNNAIRNTKYEIRNTSHAIRNTQYKHTTQTRTCHQREKKPAGKTPDWLRRRVMKSYLELPKFLYLRYYSLTTIHKSADLSGDSLLIKGDCHSEDID